jgi:hypothetical protein
MFDDALVGSVDMVSVNVVFVNVMHHMPPEFFWFGVVPRERAVGRHGQLVYRILKESRVIVKFRRQRVN